MLKSGQFALVTNDCAVRKGETVELDNRIGTHCQCWYNKMLVTINESNLTPIKAERWKPSINERYWFANGSGTADYDIWNEHPVDHRRFDSYNVHKTEAEAIAEAEATLADRKARLDK